MGKKPAPAQTTPADTVQGNAAKRPFGVTLVGVLLLVQGFILALAASTVIYLNTTLESDSIRKLLAISHITFTVTTLFSTVLIGVIGVFIVLSAIGMLRLRPWAWLAAMALQGWTLALFLIDYFTDGLSSNANYLNALLSVVIVFYLNSRTVRHAFDLARHRESGLAAVPPVITHATVATTSEATSRSNEAS